MLRRGDLTAVPGSTALPSPDGLKSRGVVAEILPCRYYGRMQASDKFRTDLDTALARAAKPDGSVASVDLEFFFKRSFTMIPAETRDDIFASFLDRTSRDREKAAEWLGTLASIFFMDYDETPLPIEDWTELREAVNLGAGDFDLELLSYVMGLVLDNHAL